MRIAVLNQSFGVMKKYLGVEERSIVHTVNKKEGQLGSPHLAWELSSETGY